MSPTTPVRVSIGHLLGIAAHGSRRPCADGFVLALAGVILSATLLPCTGATAAACHAAGTVAIGSLFFLQGARLSRESIVNGIAHWRLHCLIASTTFMLFPIIGLTLTTLFPRALPHPLWVGLLFVCALPSTVQSSIALTSIARGNVAAAVCSATASNIAGIVLAPLLFGAMSSLHGGAVNVVGVGKIVLQLLVPFCVGHTLRPWIGQWAERNRSILSITDRSSILLVAYTAFSAAVVQGLWHQVPLNTFWLLSLVVATLLAAVLVTTALASRLLGFGRTDEVAAVFCGSQKSLVSGVPIASVLFSGSTIGPILLPMMLYYPLQLVICAWLARQYASEPSSAAMPIPALALSRGKTRRGARTR